jgi:predicted CXXCH cytochrome family protein
MPSWVRGIRRDAICATVLLVITAVAWSVSDRLERDDDFCTSCHIAPGRPLHAAIRRGFGAEPAATLAAAHRGARESDFHCIDCHGGVGVRGRVRVKALAAKDAFFYVIGDFEEPTRMRWPLWDEDCRQCHDAFDERAVEAWQSPRFHQLPLHNAALGVDCVECHRAHAVGNPDGYFLRAPEVRQQCARCHSEYEEGSG